MSATRVKTAGNNPETRIVCDWSNRQGDRCREQGQGVSDYDAKDARLRARAPGGVDDLPEWERAFLLRQSESEVQR